MASFICLVYEAIIARIPANGKPIPQNDMEEIHAMSLKPIDDMGRTLLMIAARHQDGETVTAELRKGNIFQTDMAGRTALFYAAERGDEEIVWILLSSLAGTGVGNQRGALLNVKDHEGKRAEDWAELNGQDEISRILAGERGRIEYFE